MVIAFRKNDPSFSSRLIRWWTKSTYSHCEMIFTNGLTFSAFFEDFNTSFKRNIIYDSNDWDFIDIPITRTEEYKIYGWTINEDNCFYDIIGIIFTQIIPLSFENPWWWFCSEVCCAAVQQVGLCLDITPHETDPGKLYKILKERI